MNISNIVTGIILILGGMIGFFIIISNIDSSSNADSNYQKECKPMEINILGVTVRKNDTEICK